MNVMLVAQCNKRALIETRRIIDQFAERKGSRTWLTAITQQGLLALRKMLRKSARRNTAVACHWIKSAGNTELLWIVGNPRRFNDKGSVPTNTTSRDVLRVKNENQWNVLEDIALLAGIAGLFHDFGKSNPLFQKKLQGSRLSSEPYRHEWISLRLFQAFVGTLTDQEWLEKLLTSNQHTDPACFCSLLIRDGLTKAVNPFKNLPPLACVVGWLIVSHHRLPKWPGQKGDGDDPKISKIDKWFFNKLDASWNSPQCREKDWSLKEIQSLWQLPNKLPIASVPWQTKAKSLARRALQRTDLINGKKDWMADTFSIHLARLTLMLSDHFYSSSNITPIWQDALCDLYANTDRETRTLKQKLDEHLVGVSHNAFLLAKSLPALRQTLPAITRHKGFKKRSQNPRFHWQDKAYEISCGMRVRTVEHGFFGVNMASTGCGKTFANARIMYGLADEKLGCRFSIALGLRTLTLQTGNALRERLHLQDDDLAVLIGSQAVRKLHQFNTTHEQTPGSESAEDLFEQDQYVSYDGSLDDGRLSTWLEKTPKLHQMLSAPILVSTIDHLIPATESERGGKQIAPMLRLLTSDLVLDEPDDFGLADLHALCRLVNWAAMLGSRVVLSSATLPPSMIEALFAAYLEGRRAFQKCYGEPGRPLNICCAWFDENNVVQSDHATPLSFIEAHVNFVQKRVENVNKSIPLRRARLLTTESADVSPEAAVQVISTNIHNSLQMLHAAHGQNLPGTRKRVSIGLVRMANINPLVAVAKMLATQEPPDNHRIHYCIYHSQHPLAVRSAIERRLDLALTRHDPEAIWKMPDIRNALNEHPEDNHVFVVLATSVAEVGRDHDYDWAIAEPSSMRSLIQLAGRIQRHRRISPTEANLLVLSRNYNSLVGKDIAYTRPGFESEQAKLDSHDLHNLLQKGQFETINSIPRIVERYPLLAKENLADLEHRQLAVHLFGSEETRGSAYSSLWWQNNCRWSFELQRRTPFRKSAPDTEYVLYFEEESEAPQFHRVDERGALKLCNLEFERVECSPNQHISFWGTGDLHSEIIMLAESMDQDIRYSCRMFGVMRLRDQRWQYHPVFGVHSVLD